VTTSRIPRPGDGALTWRQLEVEQRGFLAGLLLTLPYAVVALQDSPRLIAFSWVAAALVSIAGLLMPSSPRLARVLAWPGVIAELALSYAKLSWSPALTLTVVLVAAWLLSSLAKHRDRSPIRVLATPSTVQGAVLGATLVLMLAGVADNVSSMLACYAAIAWVLLLILTWALADRRVDWLRRLAVASLAALAVTGAYGIHRFPVASLTVVACGLLLVAFLVRPADTGSFGPLAAILEHPARLVVVTFLLLCTIGTILLALPTSVEGARLSIIDAAFTAVSAVCVTGLTVVDTATTFSFAGQVLLAVLIQLGGLGIMALYATAFGLLGKRLSLRHEQAVASAQAIGSSARLTRSLGGLVAITLGIEALGALLLFPSFLSSESPGTAAWRASFHAISAFCNAGFALQSESLVPYANRASILHVIGTLVVLGGLSPAVIVAAPSLLSRPYRVSLQAKVALATSAVLLAGGFVGFLAFEWGNTLSHLSIADKLHNAWFQSISPRTAGFNSVDFTQVLPSTRLLTILLMFIGGSPGGTAGGIKTTTTALLILAVVAILRGRSEVSAFGFRIPSASVGKATAIATLAFATVIAFTMALLLTQRLPFDVLLFEVVSALGTVGLTLGATGALDDVGKWLIILCMFVGRVGPLTVLLLLGASRTERTTKLPRQDIQVG
jgi:trk system potassium uptake protein